MSYKVIQSSEGLVCNDFEDFSEHEVYNSETFLKTGAPTKPMFLTGTHLLLDMNIDNIKNLFINFVLNYPKLSTDIYCVKFYKWNFKLSEPIRESKEALKLLQEKGIKYINSGVTCLVEIRLYYDENCNKYIIENNVLNGDKKLFYEYYSEFKKLF